VQFHRPIHPKIRGHLRRRVGKTAQGVLLGVIGGVTEPLLHPHDLKQRAPGVIRSSVG